MRGAAVTPAATPCRRRADVRAQGRAAKKNRGAADARRPRALGAAGAQAASGAFALRHGAARTARCAPPRPPPAARRKPRRRGARHDPSDAQRSNYPTRTSSEACAARSSRSALARALASTHASAVLPRARSAAEGGRFVYLMRRSGAARPDEGSASAPPRRAAIISPLVRRRTGASGDRHRGWPQLAAPDRRDAVLSTRAGRELGARPRVDASPGARGARSRRRRRHADGRVRLGAQLLDVQRAARPTRRPRRLARRRRGARDRLRAPMPVSQELPRGVRPRRWRAMRRRGHGSTGVAGIGGPARSRLQLYGGLTSRRRDATHRSAWATSAVRSFGSTTTIQAEPATLRWRRRDTTWRTRLAVHADRI